VYKYSTDDTLTSGTPVSYSGFIDLTNKVGYFDNPSGMCIDKNDYVFVADTNNHSIQVISPIGKLCYTVLGTGTSGNSIGDYTKATFNLPSLLAIDSNSVLYVVNAAASYIRTITISTIPNTNLPFINNTSVTHNGTYPVTSSSPTGVPTYNNNLAGTSFVETLDFT
jgi:hypothetical protein